MEQFSYSFAVSMLHSIWQSAVLLGIYYAVTAAFKYPHPLFKRNLLYGFAATQVLLTVLTFTIYSTNSLTSVQATIGHLISDTLLQKQGLQQYAPWLFYFYSLIVLYKMIAGARHWMLFKKSYVAGLVKPPADIKMFTASKALHFGIAKKVAVWYSNTIKTPVVFGFLKPIILLPVALVNQLSVEETEALIVHELTHIRSNDYLLNWLLLATETIYFFNPFIRIMAAKIQLEREKNCDVQVLQFQYCQVSYASALLKAARYKNEVKDFQLAAVFNRFQLLTRIRFFSDEKNIGSVKRNSLVFSLPALFLLIVFTCSILAKPVVTTVSAPLTHILLPVLKEKNEGNIINTNTISSDEPLSDIVKENGADATSKPAVNNNDKTRTLPVSGEAENNDLPLPAAVREINIVPVSYHPASLQTIQPANEGRQVIINEESSNGKMITKAYHVKLKDGKWITEPLWIIAESKADSLKKKMGDSLMNVVPEVQ